MGANWMAVVSYVMLSPAPASGFEETFDRSAVIEEAPAPASSTSATWWLNSGARVTFEAGTGHTLTGTLAPSDPWAGAYSLSNPVDTDGGLRPQNVFRLMTRETGLSFRQRVSAKILATNLTESSERGRFSGLFLDSRFLDDRNVYVAGLRFDGSAVITKRRGGTSYTLGITEVYAGSYDRRENPNLLPHGRWFSLRSTIQDVASGVRILLEVHDPKLQSHWIPVLEVIDGWGGADGPPLTVPGRAGLRSDFMDVEFENYLAFEPPDVLPDSVGVRDEETGTVLLQVAPTPGTLPRRLTLGPEVAALPITGRWSEASCGDHVGFYDPVAGRFALPVGSALTEELVVFVFGPPDAGLYPVAGDWDGDGVDGVGIYDPTSGTFFLTNRLGPGPAEVMFVFGAGGDRFLPVAGDWDDDGRDSIGIYDVERGMFFVKNELNGGVADTVFSFGPGGSGLLPISGDWIGRGPDAVGLFRTSDGIFALRHSLSAGFADRIETVAPSVAAGTPVAGRWEETCR